MPDLRVANFANIDRAALTNALGQVQLEKQGAFNRLAPQIARGDEAATRQGLALAPEQTAQVIQALAGLDKIKRQQLAQTTQEAARSLYALEQLPEAQRPQAYRQWLAMAQTKGWVTADDPMPPEYDPFAVKSQINEAMTLDQLIKQADEKAFTLSPGQTRYDAQGRPIASAPQGQGGPFEGTSIDAQTYNILLQGNPASPEYALAYWRATQPRLIQTPEGLMPVQPAPLPGNIRPPVNPLQAQPGAGTGIAPSGGVPAAPGGAPAPQGGAPVIPGTAPKLDLNQTNAATFADRMQQATSEIEDIISQGYDPTNAKDAVARSTPVVGNYAVSDLGQRYQQAAENWVTANLRRESGAAITETEMANEVKKYFPNPGDGPAVVEQKRRARETVQRGMIRAAGPMYEPPLQEGQTATNPQTGERIIFKGGKWQKM